MIWWARRNGPGRRLAAGGPLSCVASRKMPDMAMAIAALVVAIIGTATGLGSLFWQFTTWKRSGWDLDVIAYWDHRRQETVVEITNTGRQECVISEVRYFVDDTSEKPSDFAERTFFVNDPLPAPLAASAKSSFTRPMPGVPESFTLEVWVWTGGKPYKSQKYEVTDSADRSIGSRDDHPDPADHGHIGLAVGEGGLER
jgi:hypothetical protein